MPKSKRMRLPNGFGQISEIKGKRLRKRFRAMVTVGKTPEGKPICRILKPQGYFETYNDAYAALLEYNKNPYDPDNDITMKELFDRWFEEHSKTLRNEKCAKNLIYSWRWLGDLYDIKVRDIRVRHIKEAISNADTSDHNKFVMKGIVSMMLDYAIEYEITDRNYGREFKLIRTDPVVKESHTSFSEAELNTIWRFAGKSKWVDMILVECYSGWRPNELCSLDRKNIDLDIGVMIGGSKTDAGRNRKVPIHSKIIDIVGKYKGDKTEGPLFGSVTYNLYHNKFVSTLSDIGITAKHRPHDCRVTFVTLAKKYSLDEYAIKMIVGHAISDITEKVYTRREFSWLREEMEKIK